MRINLKKMKLVNFKGINHFEIDLNHVTNVYGDNATGKTTIFDAFLWLFFGKNSEDKSDFEVKRLDSENRFIKNLESEVEATILVDKQEIVVKKVLRQKWVKRRGELEANYNGDENVYYWNDVPLKESEFRVKVAGIVEEKVFKLITNPFYFNGLKWQERRNILVEIAGDISNNDVLDAVINVSNKGRFNALINALNTGKTIDEFKRELAAKKKKVKDEAESIPSRIDEVRRGMPAPADPTTETKLAAARKEIAELELTLNDNQAAERAESKRRADIMKEYNDQVRNLQQRIFDLKTAKKNIEFEAQQAAKDAGSKLNAQISSVSSLIAERKFDAERFENGITRLTAELKAKENELNGLREKYVAEDEKTLVFNDNEFSCPSCKQALPMHDMEAKKTELTANFNNDKLKKLKSIQTDAGTIKTDIETINARITNGKASLKTTTDELNELEGQLTELQNQAVQSATSEEEVYNTLLDNSDDYEAKSEELTAVEAKLAGLKEPTFDDLKSGLISGINDRKNELMAVISTLTKEQAKAEQIEMAEKRICELTEQEARLANELNELEGSEFAIMEFSKAKVDAIEKRINGKFSAVKFKMFEQQVNGGESETCLTLVNSNGSFVPFTDANNAAKINAGIDIINTLCNHYDVHAPIFIDNRESVTRLAESNSQIVNLIVSEKDKSLRVA